jgi:uncharacterized protein
MTRMSLPVIQPSRMTVMIKPVGALCNLDCHYCYYLPTKAVFGGHEHRMSLATLESVFAGTLPRFGDDVTIAWQGGEPTLAGLAFFRQAMAFQQRYVRPGQRIHHAIQTNGTLLDDDWCRFLRKHDFLVGLSIDGPEHLHDQYRVTNAGRPSLDRVLQGMNLLRKHGVEYNILCVVNDQNVHHPEEVLAFLLNQGARWVQFIPAVEWVRGPDGKNALAPFSPDPEDLGRFLCRVFDLWFERHRKFLSVRDFDAILNRLVIGQMPYCILDGACHNQLTVEHDGSVFGCDHFVERRWQLAQIGEPGWRNDIATDGSCGVGLTVHGTGFDRHASKAGRDIATTADLDARYDFQPAAAAALGLDADWFDRVDSQRLGEFSARKQNLPESCNCCEWRSFCHGGCPKHRAAGGEIPQTTSLCVSYKMFYEHAMLRLRWLADYLRAGRMPPDPPAGPGRTGRSSGGGGGGLVRQALAVPAEGGDPRRTGRNDPCPCGSGLKYKRCHGR